MGKQNQRQSFKNKLIMKTFYLIACTLILSTTTFAQHDMKDMPGMKMQKGETKKGQQKGATKKCNKKRQQEEAIKVMMMK